ncbi:hypothetical protein C4K04_4026 [Pseudomonas chlororaphis]|uniref:Uncharacterized protein n=1 Tax=Pseudomonas chlororaphis TaxID=587753 RepID=A0A3G7TRF5_9PSED|nr:hypothetical protein C4K04_4026 [Pseudomonas chlororaphis]
MGLTFFFDRYQVMITGREYRSAKEAGVSNDKPGQVIHFSIF